jgi:hypothetical protein
LKQPKPHLTHAQLGQRGAMWLRNRKNCRFADRCKPFCVDPALGMGLFRHFLAPAGVLTVEDVKGDWGLLEARGRSIFVLKEALPQPIRNCAEEVSQFVQALAQAQLRVFEPLHRWLTGSESPVGQMRTQQKVLREEMKTRECSHYALPRGGGPYVQAVPCHTLVANGYSRCTEHGGKSRKLPRAAQSPKTSEAAA